MYRECTLYAQLLRHFQADPFEILHRLLGWSEDMHIVFFRILKLFFITFYCIFNLDLLVFFCCFFFLSYEITLYCFSSCLTLIVFSPYTKEVHREYVPVAGHGAWLAVLFIIRVKLLHRFWRALKVLIDPQNSLLIFYVPVTIRVM